MREEPSGDAVQNQVNTWASDIQRGQFQARGFSAAQQSSPVAQTKLRSGSCIMDSSNSESLVVLNVQGTSFNGQSYWNCCPLPRIDPIVEGTIANGRWRMHIR